MSVKGIPVVMYHSVAPDRPGWLWNHLTTPVDVFDGQMRMLRDRGWTTITLERLHSHMKDNAPLPPKPIVLTFDDGYLDNWVYVWPILKKYGHRAVIWMSTDFIDPSQKVRPRMDDSGWKDGRALKDGGAGEGPAGTGFLSWPEMKAMADSGHVEIQSHARTHTWYYSSDRIVDFHRPAGAGGYEPLPWLSWNVNPGEKYSYMSRDFGKDVPYGTPIYEHGMALTTRRYFDDPDLAGLLRRHVEINGGAGFFSRPGWKEELERIAAGRPAGGGRIETAEEYEARVLDELAGSRKILSEGLGRPVDFLCWPGGGYNDATLGIASRAGYLATTTLYEDPDRRNVFGEPPGEINRMGCCSPWAWKGGVVVRNTEPGILGASLDVFAGKKQSIWKMRWYKLKYLVRYYLTGNR